MATNTSNNSIFNPDVQAVQEPNYLGLSKSIQDLKNYGSTGALLTGAGQVGADVVKVAHELTQENLEDKIHAGVDQIRDPYTKQLGDTLAALQQGGQKVKVTTGTAVADATLMSKPAATATPPVALQKIDQSVGTIVGAKENGHISQTDYKMRLDAFTKDLNAQYPGWRDYIAQKVSAVSNEGVADDLIKGRIADINSFIDNKKDGKDKIEAIFLREDMLSEPGVVEHYMQFKNDGDVYKALSFLNKIHADKAVLNHAKIDLELGDTAIKDRSQKAHGVATIDASQGITNIMSGVFKSFGWDENPEKALKSFSEANPVQQQQFRVNLENKLQAFYLKKKQDWNMPYESDRNRSIAVDLGLDKVMPILEAAAAPYKALADKISGGDFQYASILTKQTEAMHSIAENNMTKDPDMGPFILAGKTLEKNFGSNAVPLMIDQGLLSDMPKAYAAMMRRQFQRRAGDEPQPDTGKVSTLDDSITEAQRNVLNDPKIAAADKAPLIAKLADRYIKQIESIVDPKIPDEVKRRYVEQAFSQEGRGLLAKMETDGIGPGGKKGGYSVYQRLYAEDMTDAIKKLGGKHWDIYEDSAKTSLQNELIAPSIRKLNTIQRDPDTKIIYDDRTFHFRAEYGRGINPDPNSTFNPTYTDQRSRLVNQAPVSGGTKFYTDQFLVNFNKAIDKYAYIENKKSGDVSGRIIKMLIDLNFDPTISTPEGINKQLIDSMVSTSKAKRELQEQLDAKYKKK